MSANLLRAAAAEAHGIFDGVAEDRLAQVEERFAHVAEVARRVLDAPAAFVSVVGRERQFNVGRSGSDLEEFSTEDSFCADTVAKGDLLVIPDTAADERYAHNPFVERGEIRFYAGQPVPGPDGTPIGTVCVVDSEPRATADLDPEVLRSLATWAAAEFAGVDAEEAHARRRTAEQRVREIGDLQHRLITTTSHGLRGPITAIRGHSELLLHPASDPLTPQQRESVEEIQAAAARLELAASQLLDAFRDAAGGADEALRARLAGMLLAQDADEKR